MVGPAYGARITSHTLRAAVLPLGDQLGSFEHGHVLLHGGKRHLIARGQLADGRVGVHHPSQDVAPRGVGQRAEQLVEVVRRWLIYNHLVVYISTPRAFVKIGGQCSASSARVRQTTVTSVTCARA